MADQPGPGNESPLLRLMFSLPYIRGAGLGPYIRDAGLLEDLRQLGAADVRLPPASPQNIEQRRPDDKAGWFMRQIIGPGRAY